MSLIERMERPSDIMQFGPDELRMLCEEIRGFLINTISQTGGHIGANLGVVELTVALHTVFDAETDTLLFDTGHQGYTHKLLTGRGNRFHTLNTLDGMSRFLCRKESPYDAMDASHAGTASSVAVGMSLSNQHEEGNKITIAVIGDGALVEGMSFEGMNFAGPSSLRIIFVVNDNGMAIAENVGGIKKLFEAEDWRVKSRYFFEGLGFQYLSVGEGHDLNELIRILTEAKKKVNEGAVIVHIKTEKGRGLELAKTHPYKAHFSMPFDPKTGEGLLPAGPDSSYAAVAARKLYEFLQSDEKTWVLTPGTPYASALEPCLKDFPERTIDVGMAEQAALGIAAGLALKGRRPFVCYQSTFLQRGFDQMLHEICFMDLPVTLLVARSGFAGYDGPTHHGIFDLSYMRCLPNVKMFYPGNSQDLRDILDYRVKHLEGPLVILYPYEPLRPNEAETFEKRSDITAPQVVVSGREGTLVSVGNTLEYSLPLQRKLRSLGVHFGVVNLRWIKPLPEKHLEPLMRETQRMVSIEENVLAGGLGSALSEMITDKKTPCELLRMGIPDCFVKAGDKRSLGGLTGLDTDSVLERIKGRWGELFKAGRPSVQRRRVGSSLSMLECD